MFRKLLATAALAAFSATTSFAQVPATGSPAPIKGANSQFRAKQILGSQIMIQGNTAVGTVDDLVFDEAGNLEYLVVENAGKLSTVPWEAAKFDLEKKMAVLPLTSAQYNLIPTYTTTTYPSYYTPAYRTQMYKFYNLTPRELRRIDRRNP
jgi:sporulation protein YlmC with PRC-barrel domain